MVTIVRQNEPDAFGEWHRQVAHETRMIDLHHRRLVIHRAARHGPEEVGEGHAYAGLRRLVPKDLQDQPRIPSPDRIVGDVEISYPTWPLELGQNGFTALEHRHLMKGGHRSTDSIGDAIEVGGELAKSSPRSCGPQE